MVWTDVRTHQVGASAPPVNGRNAKANSSPSLRDQTVGPDAVSGCKLEHGYRGAVKRPAIATGAEGCNLMSGCFPECCSVAAQTTLMPRRSQYTSTVPVFKYCRCAYGGSQARRMTGPGSGWRLFKALTTEGLMGPGRISFQCGSRNPPRNFLSIVFPFSESGFSQPGWTRPERASPRSPRSAACR